MLILLIFILVFATGFLLPWWVLAIICFAACGWLAVKASEALASSFLAVFVAWVLLALIKSVPNDNILAGRVATLFHLPGWLALMGVTGLIGGLVGACAGLSGYYCRKAFLPAVPAEK